jgi:hypothetical protein
VDSRSKLRLEIKKFLIKRSSSLANFYEGAVRFLEDPNFPGRDRLICYSVREICNRLPDIISGSTRKKSFEYSHLVEGIYKSWRRLNYPETGGLPKINIDENSYPLNTLPIDREVFEKVAHLISMHTVPKENKSVKAERLFFGEESDYSQFRPFVEHWIKMTDWFSYYKRIHASDKPDPESLYNGLNDQFELFEDLLLTLIREIFDTTSELDDILEDTNSKTD